MVGSGLSGYPRIKCTSCWHCTDYISLQNSIVKGDCWYGFFLRHLLACWEQRLMGKQVDACTQREKKKVLSWDKMIKLCLNGLSDWNIPCTFGLQLHPTQLFSLAATVPRFDHRRDAVLSTTFWSSLQKCESIERHFTALSNGTRLGWQDLSSHTYSTTPYFTSIPWQYSTTETQPPV